MQDMETLIRLKSGDHPPGGVKKVKEDLTFYGNVDYIVGLALIVDTPLGYKMSAQREMFPNVSRRTSAISRTWPTTRRRPSR